MMEEWLVLRVSIVHAVGGLVGHGLRHGGDWKAEIGPRVVEFVEFVEALERLGVEVFEIGRLAGRRGLFLFLFRFFVVGFGSVVEAGCLIDEPQQRHTGCIDTTVA